MAFHVLLVATKQVHKSKTTLATSFLGGKVNKQFQNLIVKRNHSICI
jgi:hypothetical protein